MAELFYESERAKLWLGDAAEVLPNYRTESFDLVVTDPPYGVDFQSGMRAESFKKIANDSGDAEARVVVADLLLECVRLVGQNRHLVIAGPEVLSQIDAKVSAPAELIWVKQDGPGMGDLSNPYGPQHEKWHFYTSMHRHAGKRGSENNPVRIRKGTVLKAVKPTGLKVRHPTEKPLSLLREFIESSSKMEEVVLDPFAGVGSTGVAAVLLGRKAFLCEMEREYAEIARDRLIEAERMWKEMQRL